MALEMHLELEGPETDWKAVREALRRTGVEELELFDDLTTFNVPYFTRSHAQIMKTQFHNWESDDRTWHKGPRPFVSAEGNHGCKFTVSGGLIFRLINSLYDESVEDIKSFLTHLTELSPMQFVLSFQGEGIYAIRDHKRGFEWFWNDPR